MLLSTLINTPCTLIRRSASGNTDRYGDDEAIEQTVETVCEVQQRRRAEVDDAQVSSTEWRGYFPAGTDLDTADAVTVDELGTFEVVGDTWPVRDPFSQTPSHVEATLRKIRSAGDTP